MRNSRMDVIFFFILPFIGLLTISVSIGVGIIWLIKHVRII